MSNAMDGKNISNRHCSEELWSFTSCSRRTEIWPQHWPRTCQHGIRSGCNPRQFLRVFGMHLSRKIFSVSEQLSRTLQTKDISMSDALKAADITLSCIQEPTKWCSLWRVLWQRCSAFCWKNIWSLGTESQKDKEILRRYKFCSSTCVRNPKRLL